MAPSTQWHIHMLHDVWPGKCKASPLQQPSPLPPNLAPQSLQHHPTLYPPFTHTRTATTGQQPVSLQSKETIPQLSDTDNYHTSGVDTCRTNERYTRNKFTSKTYRESGVAPTVFCRPDVSADALACSVRTRAIFASLARPRAPDSAVGEPAHAHTAIVRTICYY